MVALFEDRPEAEVLMVTNAIMMRNVCIDAANKKGFAFGGAFRVRSSLNHSR